MKQYHDLYLPTDVLLPADIFENFREFSLENYKLDPCHYFTAPGLSFDACLRMTGVKLELFTDPNMLLMIEKGIRGGIAQISKRQCTANNRYLPDFDPTKDTTYIAYLDANNLYGWSMSQFLPVGGFQWLKEEEVAQFNVEGVGESDDVGYILECDLLYPEDTHDLHNDYPLAPEKIKVSPDMLSDHQKHILETTGRKFLSNQPKLIPIFFQKGAICPAL